MSPNLPERWPRCSVKILGMNTTPHWDARTWDTERLLELELDPGIAERLVHATLASAGDLAAKRVLQRLQERFLTELDAIPGELTALEGLVSVVN